MNCSRNEVVLLPIPFTDLTSRKVRPAIVIGRNGADLFLVPISSQLSNTDFAFGWQVLHFVRREVIGEGSLIVRPATMKTPSP